MKRYTDHSISQTADPLVLPDGESVGRDQPSEKLINAKYLESLRTMALHVSSSTMLSKELMEMLEEWRL